MRIVVLGNSASAGTGLADLSHAWTSLTRAALEERTGPPVELTHVTVMANGPRAVDYAMSKVESSNPDLVILVIGTYLCSVALVSEQVRHRFGNRAHAWYKKFERRFDSRTRPGGGPPGRTNSFARRLARRVIGARPLATIEQVASTFEDLMRRLAAREGMHVIVFAEPSWPKWIDKENRGAIKAWQTVVDRANAAAGRHHFPWAETNPTYATAPDRDALYQPDGVHKTIEGHRYQADALLPVLLDPTNDLIPLATR